MSDLFEVGVGFSLEDAYHQLQGAGLPGTGQDSIHAPIGSKWTDTANVNNEPSIMHFCLHYSGKANRMPFKAYVGFETMADKGNAVLDVKQSMYVGASVTYVTGMDVYLKFVQDKGTAGVGEKTNNGVAAGVAVNF